MVSIPDEMVWIPPPPAALPRPPAWIPPPLGCHPISSGMDTAAPGMDTIPAGSATIPGGMDTAAAGSATPPSSMDTIPCGMDTLSRGKGPFTLKRAVSGRKSELAPVAKQKWTAEHRLFLRRVVFLPKLRGGLFRRAIWQIRRGECDERRKAAQRGDDADAAGQHERLRRHWSSGLRSVTAVP